MENVEYQKRYVYLGEQELFYKQQNGKLYSKNEAS